MLYRLSFFILLSLLGVSCGTTDYSSVRKDYYRENYDDAADSLREIYKEAGEKDRLLYLLEAGVIYHAKGDYKKSEQVFRLADEAASTTKKSLSGDAARFIVNDNTATYTGESFEYVLIKFYLALNRIFVGDYEGAKRYFRQLDYEQKEMKLQEDAYRQNLAARYLDALLSENLGRYNDARVQFNNLKHFMDKKSLGPDLYVLAVKEGDASDRRKYAEFADDVRAYDENMKRIPYSPDMAEVVVINQAGKAARKFSRGKIADSKELRVSLNMGIHSALVARGARGISMAALTAAIASAENPIPEYRKPDDEEGESVREIVINGKKAGQTRVLTDYSSMAVADFNDRYTGMIARNVTAMSVKIATAAIAAKAAHDATLRALKKSKKQLGAGADIAALFVGAATGYLGGVVAGSLSKPDLRSWSLLPSNFQVGRIFVKPGKYRIKIPPGNDGAGASKSVEVEAESGKIMFLNVHSLSKTRLLTESSLENKQLAEKQSN
jgi:hypothetical protein